MTKKLLQINIVLDLSTGRIAEAIGQTSIKNGWESYIAYGRNDKLSLSETIKIGNNWDVKLHGLKSRLLDKHGFGSKNATTELINQIKEIKPDIIHLHNIHGYYLNIEVLFKYLASTKIPIVWTLHDCWAITGHCAHFSYVKCEKWKTHCEKCPQIKTYPKSYFIDNSYNNFKIKRDLFTSVSNMTLVPVSNWLAVIFKESFLMNYPIQVINNGVDLKKFSPQNTNSIKQKYQLENKFILLGVASTWSPRKGFDDFIKLSKILKEDEIILLVGLTEKQIKGVSKNIIGIQRTESIKELAELYSVANAFLNLTWEDTFPTTNLESLACGTPVITYKTGGSSESISDEVGYVIDQGDLFTLREKIDIIKKKGKEFYTNDCRQRTVNLYNKNDKYKEYINLYNSLL